MEASALPASVGLARARLGLGAPLLRLRSDEQLVSLFRAGNEDAFRVVHDRYRARIFAYARQMLAATSGDPEDAVQEIFVRAYAGLRADHRQLALRAWLYRIAHNRCIDELRRPSAIAVEGVEEFALDEAATADPHARAVQREALARLITDVQRLPEQQRSALLMRELGGMSYADLAGALGVSVGAVKSLLVRARVGLVQASEARDTACASIRADLIGAHDRGVRPSSCTRRHLRDCPECRAFRGEVQGVSRGLGLLLPALGPLGIVARVVGLHALGLGVGSSGGAAAGTGTGAAAGSTAVAAGSTAVAAASSAAAGGGALAVASGHVVTIIAAATLAAGGAIGIQQVAAASHPAVAHHRHAGASTPAASVVPAAAPLAAVTSSPHVTNDTLAAASTLNATHPTMSQTTTSASSASSSPTERHARDDGGTVATTIVPVTTTIPVTTTGTTSTTSTGTTSTTSTTGTTAPTTTTTGAAGTTTPTTDPTSTTGTASTTTASDPTSTVPVTTIPAGGSGTTTLASTGAANPGTATGIVPTIVPASTTGDRHRLHERIWRTRRGATAASATVR